MEREKGGYVHTVVDYSRAHRRLVDWQNHERWRLRANHGYRSRGDRRYRRRLLDAFRRFRRRGWSHLFDICGCHWRGRFDVAAPPGDTRTGSTSLTTPKRIADTS